MNTVPNMPLDDSQIRVLVGWPARYIQSSNPPNAGNKAKGPDPHNQNIDLLNKEK